MYDEIKGNGFIVKKVSKKLRSDKKGVYVDGPPLENNSAKQPGMDNGSFRDYLVHSLLKKMYK